MTASDDDGSVTGTDEPNFPQLPVLQPQPSPRVAWADKVGGKLVKGDKGDVAPWLSCEVDGDLQIGDPVAAPVRALRRGDRGLAEHLPGRFVFSVQLKDSEVEEFLAKWGVKKEVEVPPAAEPAPDAQVLPIKMGVRGRNREWLAVVDDCEEEAFPDFPLPGPRTSSWCLHFLRRRHTPVDHHLMFKQMARLNADAWGVQEHEQIMRLLELGGEYDQLDLSNCAWAEAALRRAQTIEWVYHEKLREQDYGGGERLSPEEASAFSGVSRAGDHMMVAPALLAHVRTVVETDVNIMKSVRKAREERELRRNNNKGGNKDNKGGNNNKNKNQGDDK